MIRPDSDMHADIVVVGAGGCGLTVAAASALAAPELRVVVLERDASQPCNSVIAGELIPAAGTRFQRAAGSDDSPELMADDITRKSGDSGDPQLTLRICRKAADAIHWIVDTAHVPMTFVPTALFPGHSRRRMHAHASHSAGELFGGLRARVLGLPNVIYRDKTPGRGLLTGDRGVVVGVLADTGTTTQRILARRVVLTTGGFGANREMLATYMPAMKDAPYVGAATSTGDGIQWGLAVGAASRHMHSRQDFGYAIFGGSAHLGAGVIWSGGIVVTRAGLRMEREDQGPSEWAAVILRQPEKFVVAIWDERIHRLHAHQKAMVRAMAEGAIIRCETVDSLATLLALDGGNLTATLAAYNRGAVTGCDPLGRANVRAPLGAPYYAARVTGSLAHTQGGLVIDLDGRVLRADGEPVPNLYAGGGVAAGLSGDRPEGYLPGNGLLTAYVLGLIIGEDLAGSLRPT